MSRILAAIVAIWLAITLGCDKKAEQAKKGSSPAAQKDTHEHEADHHEGHEHHAREKHELGTMKVGDFEVRASREAGALEPGGDALIDVWVTGEANPVAAVRSWIGSQDARGSMKARAEAQDPREANPWHTHVEVPDPLPTDARLWIEIETVQNTFVVGFDLQP